ncbi:Hypothetical protein D9617_1g088000 [Elsinoe fawcettii]|nr:Hypothetical protein D9617_1g088000 [Elsinoe fawcettii]
MAGLNSEELSHLKTSLEHPYLLPDCPWGFALYRCSYTDESAWQKLLDLTRRKTLEILQRLGSSELWSRHDMPVFDVRSQHEGHTAEQVRRSFNRWAAQEYDQRAEDPRPLWQMTNPASKSMFLESGKYASAPRFNYCLFVDDICLESVKRMRRPVVKLLDRTWEPLPDEEQSDSIHPDFHDGTTGFLEEDVGWTYMHVDEYVETYDSLAGLGGRGWYTDYIRPPGMYCTDPEDEPGAWREEQLGRRRSYHH